jgi:hypothetical protein
MADSTTDIPDRRGESLAEPPAAAPAGAGRPPFAATLALVMTLAVGAFAFVMPVVLIVHRPTVLPPPFPAQNQGAETLVYLLSFVVILPLALVVAPRIADAVHAASGADALSALAGGLAASLAVAVLGVKLCDAVGIGDGVKVVLLIAVVWWAAAAGALARAGRGGPWPALVRVGRFAGPLWVAAAVLVLATLLCMTVLRSVSPVGLVLGGAAAAAALVAHERGRVPRPARGLGVAIDVVAVALLVLVVPDLLVFRPEDAGGSLAIALETNIIQFHQNFLLGPANEVLHGGAMLVDTASQYGVGTIYLLTGWFQLAPIGYGTFGLLDGLLTALWFCGGYAIVRMAGAPRTLAATALGVAVVALVFNLSYPVGALPQDGPLRFGLPMAALAAMVAGECRPAARRAWGLATLVVIGISSIWSLEGLAYTVAVAGAVACLQAWLRPGPGRRAWLVRQGAAALAACVCTHVLFAAVTLAATGHLPDWWQYLSYLHAFLFGGLGDLTYDVAHWTPALAIGAAYAASAAAVVELVRRRGAFLARERPALVAVWGLTVYGIALLSYYVDRSQDHILMHVSLPLVLIGAVWLGLLLRSRDTVAPSLRLGGLVFGLVVGVLALSVAWSSIGPRFPRTALAHAAPGGSSLTQALRRLWHPPPLNANSPIGVALLQRYMPAERRSLVMVAPDLGTEILLRSDRVDELFLGDPWEASFVADARLPGLRRQLAKVHSGRRMLMDGRAEKVIAVLKAHPSIDPLDEGGPLASDLAPLQRWALRWIAARFTLRPIHRDSHGFIVVELQRRARA